MDRKEEQKLRPSGRGNQRVTDFFAPFEHQQRQTPADTEMKIEENTNHIERTRFFSHHKLENASLTEPLAKLEHTDKEHKELL